MSYRLITNPSFDHQSPHPSLEKSHHHHHFSRSPMRHGRGSLDAGEKTAVADVKMSIHLKPLKPAIQVPKKNGIFSGRPCFWLKNFLELGCFRILHLFAPVTWILFVDCDEYCWVSFASKSEGSNATCIFTVHTITIKHWPLIKVNTRYMDPMGKYKVDI